MLDTCPQCSYSMTGLPEEHACPECGLRYDKVSEVYKHHNPKVLLSGMVGFLGGTGGVVNLTRTFGSAGPFWRVCIMIFLVVYFGGAVWLARYFYRLYRSGPLVAVLPDGLFVRLRKVEGEWIPWMQVSRAYLNHSNRKFKGVSVAFKNGKPDLNIIGFFVSPDDCQRFVSQVAARVEIAPKSSD